jgi:hypothetical protein
MGYCTLLIFCFVYLAALFFSTTIARICNLTMLKAEAGTVEEAGDGSASTDNMMQQEHQQDLTKYHLFRFINYVSQRCGNRWSRNILPEPKFLAPGSLNFWLRVGKII